MKKDDSRKRSDGRKKKGTKTVFIRKIDRKNGKARYYVIVKDNGRQKSHGGFDRKGDADDYKRLLETHIANGTYGRQDPMFLEFYDQWLASKEKSLKPSNIAAYRAVFRLHIIPRFKDSYLIEINTRMIQRWVDELYETNLSTASVNRVYRYLRACLLQAYVWGYIETNPCLGILLPREDRSR